jgi:hypothetical protein
MHFLTSQIILVGFAFVVYVGLVLWELSQLSFHESPVVREAIDELAAAEDAKEVKLYGSSPTELSDTH